MKNEQPRKNIFELLELMKKYKKRVTLGVTAAAVLTGAVALSALENNESQKFSTPEDPKSSIEDFDPNIKLPKGGLNDSVESILGLPEDREKEGLKDLIDEFDKKDTLQENVIGGVEKENETVIQDAHVHTFGDFQFVDGQSEIASCDCGEMISREHSFASPSIVYNFNGNDTHDTITTITCDTCDYVSKLTEVDDCFYTIKEYDNDYEYKVCNQCGGKTKTSHEYDLGIDNLDGTTTYSCIHENCLHELILPTPGYTIEEHIHDYGKAVVTYKDITPTKHTIVSTQRCLSPDCEDPLNVVEQTVKHTFDSGIISNGKIVYTCNDCGYQKTRNYSYDNNDNDRPTRPSHSHSYGESVITYKDITDMGHTVVNTSSCTGCSSVIVSEATVSHEFGEGVLSEDGTKIIFTCKCGYQKIQDYVPEVHNHDYKESITYKDITDNTHTKVSVKKCQVDGCDNPMVSFEEVLAHEFDEGILNDAETEITYTCTCGYQKTEAYAHTHSDAPADLVYVFDHSNSNGTHTLTASYLCTKCGEEVVATKPEDCEYTTSYESIGITNPTNIHNVINTCDVCGYETKTTGSCTKTGEMQFVKIYDNIYEYYDCADCHGYVDRDYHTEHVFGEWEIDESRHVRYCGCVEGREEGYHTYENGECTACGYALDHEHAPDGMDLMDLIFSPFYDQLVSKSNFTNPNPNPDEYCFRYDLICSTCGTHYSIRYDHNYENGICKRTDCRVADPNYVSDIVYEDNSYSDVKNDSTSNSDVLKLERTLGNENY